MGFEIAEKGWRESHPEIKWQYCPAEKQGPFSTQQVPHLVEAVERMKEDLVDVLHYHLMDLEDGFCCDTQQLNLSLRLDEFNPEILEGVFRKGGGIILIMESQDIHIGKSCSLETLSLLHDAVVTCLKNGWVTKIEGGMK